MHESVVSPMMISSPWEIDDSESAKAAHLGSTNGRWIRGGFKLKCGFDNTSSKKSGKAALKI